MARFTLLFSAAAFLLLDSLSIWRAEGQAQTPDINKAVHIDCLKEMNAARSLVGFAAFKDGRPDKTTTLPLADQNFVNVVCKDVAFALDMAPVHENEWNYAGEFSTHALAARVGSKPDCAAAVEYWKSALPKIKGLPPVVQFLGSSFYNDVLNQSFVVLFNPQENPTIDCALFTCQLKERDYDDSANDGQKTKTSPEIKTGYAINCLTSPDAYTEGREPYTKEQWEKITEGLTRAREGVEPSGGSQPSGGLAPLPSFLAFAAAALAVALL